MGRSKSLKMVPFKSFGTVSYLQSVTMAVSCIISETKRAIGRKSRFFSYPMHSMTPLEGYIDITFSGEN